LSAAYSLHLLGLVASKQGDYERAAALAGECLALSREEGDRWLISFALLLLGEGAREQGHLEQARPLIEESLALSREVGDRWTIALQLVQLGNVTHDQGLYEQASALYKEGLGLSWELVHECGISWGPAALSNRSARYVYFCLEGLASAAGGVAADLAARGARPDVVWHSGKLRARQTAEIFWRACNALASTSTAET